MLIYFIFRVIATLLTNFIVIAEEIDGRDKGDGGDRNPKKHEECIHVFVVNIQSFLFFFFSL